MTPNHSNIPKFEDINAKVLFNGFKNSYANAEDYYYEAEILFQMRKYGHSAALSVLGIEELSKSINFLFLSKNKCIPFLHTINPNIIIEDIDNNDLNKTIKNMYNHSYKHASSYAYSLIHNLFMRDFFELWLKLNDEEKNDLDYLKKEMKLIINKSRRRLLNSKWIEKDYELIRKLQIIKEKGMYVEIKNNNLLSTPKDVTFKESKDCLKLLDKYLNEWSLIDRITWSPLLNEY